MEPTHLISLLDGRRMAVDVVGDPAGVPVVYLHGTPDSRLARHPDDGLAARAGVALIAVDRPGSGHSAPYPDGTLASLGSDLATVADHLDIDRFALVGWSAGGLLALGAASALGPRVPVVVAVATLPPVEAYADGAVVEALGPARRAVVEMAAEMSADEVAAEIAAYVVPDPVDADLALEHVLAGAGPVGRAELAEIPGAPERFAAALVASVRQGRAGLLHDLALQLEPGLDLGAITAAVHSIHGSADEVSPPAVGEWLQSRLHDGRVEVVPGGGHHVLVARWTHVLATARDLVLATI